MTPSAFKISFFAFALSAARAFQVKPPSSRSPPILRSSTSLSVATVPPEADFWSNLRDAALSFFQPQDPETVAEQEWEWEWEWYPEPPQETPPAYLLQELSWVDVNVKNMDYGGMRKPTDTVM